MVCYFSGSGKWPFGPGKVRENLFLKCARTLSTVPENWSHDTLYVVCIKYFYKTYHMDWHTEREHDHIAPLSLSSSAYLWYIASFTKYCYLPIRLDTDWHLIISQSYYKNTLGAVGLLALDIFWLKPQGYGFLPF